MRRTIPGLARAFLISLAIAGCAEAPVKVDDKYNAIEKQVNEHYKKHEYFLALAKYNQALAAQPTHVLALASRARTYLLLGLPKEAIRDCSKSLSLAKTDADRSHCWNWRGRAENRDNQYETAIADLTRTLDYDAKAAGVGAGTYWERGAAFLSLGRLKEALKDLDKAVELDPKSNTFLGARARAHLENGDASKALADAEKVIANSSSNPEQMIVYTKGAALFALGRKDEARQVRLEIYKLRQLPPPAANSEDSFFFDLARRRRSDSQWLQQARSFEAEGKWSEAFQRYRQIKDWTLYLSAEDKKTFKEAIDGIVRVYSRVTPKLSGTESERSYLIQAETLAKNGMYERAVDIYKSMTIRQPWAATAYFNIATIYGEQKIYDAAIENMRTYLALEPNAEDSRAARDKIYEWQALASAMR